MMVYGTGSSFEILTRSCCVELVRFSGNVSLSARRANVKKISATFRDSKFPPGSAYACRRSSPQAESPHLAVSHISRLNAGAAAAGIDLVDCLANRLAKALATTVAELLPTTTSPDTEAALRHQAQRLFEALVRAADREALFLL